MSSNLTPSVDYVLISPPDCGSGVAGRVHFRRLLVGDRSARYAPRNATPTVPESGSVSMPDTGYRGRLFTPRPGPKTPAVTSKNDSDCQADACATWTPDGITTESLFSTWKYSFLLERPSSGSRKSRSHFTDSASHTHTARVPSFVGKE
jgi:hypothetical protein